MTAYLKTFPPHIHSSQSVPKINWRIALSLVPVFSASILAHGFEALRIESISVGTVVLTDYFSSLLFHKKIRLYDGSTFLIGLLLGMILPLKLPAPFIAAASFEAVFLGREIFGGTAANIFHPAVLGFLLLWKMPQALSFWIHSGTSLADTSSEAVLLSALLLVLQRLIDGGIPLIYLAVVFIGSTVLGTAPRTIFSGSDLFAAFFLITDPVTTPLTKQGRILFAAGAAVLGLGIAKLEFYPAPIFFAIFMMNALTPWLDHWFRPRPPGSSSPSYFKKRWHAIVIEDFFLAGFAIAFYCLKSGGFETLKTTRGGAAVIALFTLLRFLITGIQMRLLFSPVPRPFSGLPIFLVSVALLAMAVSWIPIP